MLRYNPDVREGSCFPSLQKSFSTPSRNSQSHSTQYRTHTQANTVHSDPEDSFGSGDLVGRTRERSVLVISDIVRVNVHPQESSSKSFSVF